MRQTINLATVNDIKPQRQTTFMLICITQYLSSGLSGIPNSPVRNILLISSIFSWAGKETKDK